MFSSFTGEVAAVRGLFSAVCWPALTSLFSILAKPTWAWRTSASISSRAVLTLRLGQFCSLRVEDLGLI
jgi:hypothetical protein